MVTTTEGADKHTIAWEGLAWNLALALCVIGSKSWTVELRRGGLIYASHASFTVWPPVAGLDSHARSYARRKKQRQEDTTPLTRKRRLGPKCTREREERDASATPAHSRTGGERRHKASSLLSSRR